MTLEMQEMLEREMDDALAITDPDRRHDATLTVLAHQSRALIDCQRKTADRVKVIAAEHPQLVADVRKIETSVENGKRKIIDAGLAALKWIALGGGGAEFVRWYFTQS